MDPTPPSAPHLSRTGLLFAGLVLAGLALPLVQFKANRIVPGAGLLLWQAVAPPVGVTVSVGLAMIALIGVDARRSLRVRLAFAVTGLAALVLCLGLAANALMPEGDRMARVSPAAGFWLPALALTLMATDALSRLGLPLRHRVWLFIGAVALVPGILASGWLSQTSVMVEHAARADQFARSLGQHLILAFGSLLLALAVGLPLGVIIFMARPLQKPALSVLNMIQTIPSLALFGIMIPIFGWIAANVPGAAELGVAGIGLFPALVALFFYALLPVVSNTWTGLASVAPEVRDAALGIGMTPAQVLGQVELPLALPLILAAVRIVLVQNIGLAVIAGLIGGGGFGSFVFQGLNQTAMDLILLGTIPTIFLALIASIGLGQIIEALSPRPAEPEAP